MSQAIAELALKMSAASEPMVQDMKKAESAVGNFKKHAESIADIPVMEKLGHEVEHLTKHLLAAGVAALGIGSAFSMIEKGIELAVHAEKMHMSFELLLGDIGKADHLLHELKDSAADLHVSFGTLKDAGVQMLKYGFNPNDIKPALEIITDYGSALGDVKGTLESVVHTLGILQAKPVMDAKSLKPLMELGLHPYDTLATKLNKSKAEIVEMLKEGVIDAGTVTDAALSEMAQRGMGGAAKMASTLAGKVEEQQRRIAAAEKGIGWFFANLADMALQVPAFFNPLSDFDQAKEGPKVEDRGGLVSKMETVKNAITPATIAFNNLKKAADEAFASFGKSDFEKQMEAVKKLGGTKEQIDILNAANKRNLAQVEQKKLEEAVLRDQTKLMEEGVRVTEQFRTAEEKAADEVVRYSNMFKAGAISQETFNRSIAQSSPTLKEFISLTKSVQQELDKLVLGAHGAEIKKLMDAGGTEEQRKALEHLQAQRDAAKDINDLQVKANKLLEDSLTPREKLTMEAEKARVAFLRGGLNEAEYMALTNDAMKQFNAGQSEKRFAGATEAGSREAYSAIVAAQAGTDSAKDINQKQFSEMQRQTILQKEIAHKQGDAREIVVELKRIGAFKIMSIAGGN